jgi:oligopeptide/dipeptide ABC transporter ATP-binding protein
MTSAPLLEIRNLCVSFRSDEGTFRAVDDVSFSVPRGKTLALVGESGCGKSVTALSIMRLLPEGNGSIDSGEILLDGKNLTELSDHEMRTVRGNRISMIFQEPMTALNPVFKIGNQIMEVYRIHRSYSRAQAREAAIEMLDRVGIPDAARQAENYPFQLSGGMRQRAMIAMALACEPELLIADEPTTALDVTIQAQILDLMVELQEEHGTSILLITHDLGVVAQTAFEVAIMYAGRIAECGPVLPIYESPRHPYTQGLMASIPSLEDDKSRRLVTIEGAVPSLRNMPTGCRYHPRCKVAQPLCRDERPALETTDDSREVACFEAAGRFRSAEDGA